MRWVKVKGHMDQGQIRVPNKGRWAHDNVKLLHSLLVVQGILKIINLGLLFPHCQFGSVRPTLVIANFNLGLLIPTGNALLWSQFVLA